MAKETDNIDVLMKFSKYELKMITDSLFDFEYIPDYTLRCQIYQHIFINLYILENHECSEEKRDQLMEKINTLTEAEFREIIKYAEFIEYSDRLPFQANFF